MKFKGKLLFVLLTAILLMSGCSLGGTTKSTTNASQSPLSPTSSASTATTLVSVKLPINKSKLGKPIKASSMFVDNVNLYYISQTNNQVCSVNKNIAFQNSNVSSTIAMKEGMNLQYITDPTTEFLVANNNLYYTNISDNYSIYTVDTSGKNKKKLVNEAAHNMLLMGDYLYYLGPDNILNVCDIKSGTTYSSQVYMTCFDSDGTNIYYAGSNTDGSNSLNMISVDGSSGKILNYDVPANIAVNNGKVYYTNEKDRQTIYYETTDGKTRAKLTDTSAGNIRFGSGYIYYINNDSFGSIGKIYSDGTNNSIISDSSVGSFISDSGKIYYTRTVYNKDGVFKISG